jgi:Zn-dependent protease with chaperone function
MGPRQLTGLRPQTYEHPSDAKALDLLTKTAGLEKLVRKLNEWGFDRLLRVGLTGSYLRVTPDSLPDVHRTLTTACSTLDLPEVPDVYIAGGGEINAFTAGVQRPLIVLNSATVDLLTPEELLFVVAHEVGHIKSRHVLYYQIAEFIPVVGEMIGAATLGIGELFSTGLQMALLRWKRMSEFTADRAGMLGCQNADVALRTMMKLAGLPTKYYNAINPEDFIAQARHFEAMEADKLNLLAKWLSTMGATHPWTVMRGKELLEWVDNGGYEQVLKAPQALPFTPPAGIAGYCDQCGWPRRGNEAFCSGCGRTYVQAEPARS